jgi:hypothetical protein
LHHQKLKLERKALVLLRCSKKDLPLQAAAIHKRPIHQIQKTLIFILLKFSHRAVCSCKLCTYTYSSCTLVYWNQLGLLPLPYHPMEEGHCCWNKKRPFKGNNMHLQQDWEI